MLYIEKNNFFSRKKTGIQRPVKKQNYVLRLWLLALLTLIMVSSLLIIIVSGLQVDDFEKIATGGVLFFALFACAQLLGLILILFIGVIDLVRLLFHIEKLKNEINYFLELDFVGFVKIISPILSLIFSAINIYIIILYLNIEAELWYLIPISALVIILPFILFHSLILGIIAKLTNPRLLGNIVLMNSILGIGLSLVGFVILTCMVLSYYFGAPLFLHA